MTIHAPVIYEASPTHGLKGLYYQATRLDRFGMNLLRLALVIVLLWIGGLKFANYEAVGIVPLVSNSPLIGFFYRHPPPEYRAHMDKEGAVNLANERWHKDNRTYTFSHGLGLAIMSIAVLIALNVVWPQVGAVGSLLLIFMSFTTLSFLITTPEAWVPALGDTTYGFPYLSGTGRLVVKDVIMLGAAVVTMADSARTYLRKQPQPY